MWESVDKRAAGKNHDKILTQAEAITTRVQGYGRCISYQCLCGDASVAADVFED